MMGLIASLIALILTLIGTGLYFISQGWFKSLLLILSFPLAGLYILFIEFSLSPTTANNPVRGYEAMGTAIIIMLAAPICIPAIGILCGYAGDKFGESYDSKATSIIAAMICSLIFPAILAYNETIVPATKRKKADRVRLQGNFLIKVGDDFINLPCRKEFKINNAYKYHPGHCSSEPPTNTKNFRTVRELRIDPFKPFVPARVTRSHHKEKLFNCAAAKVKTKKLPRLCEIEFLPYNVTLKVNASSRSVSEFNQEFENKYSSASQRTLGRLKIWEEERRYNENSRSWNQYAFVKRGLNISCSNKRHPKNPEQITCGMRLHINDRVWAQTRLKTELSQIDNESDRVSAEIRAYYKRLVDWHGVSPDTIH